MENFNKIFENISNIQELADKMTGTAKALDGNINDLINDAVKKVGKEDKNDLNYILAQKNRIIEKAKNGEDFQSILANLQNKYR